MISQKTLQNLTGSARMLIVGDIHGCAEEFDALLNKVRFRHGTDCLVLVGDLVNKGYDSIGVVQRAIKYRAHCVLGNHDAALIAEYDRIREGEVDPNAPERQSDPLTQLAAKFPRECYEYLLSLPHILKIPQFNVLVVHAGLNPKMALDDQNLWELLHMRRILPNGRIIDFQVGGDLWATKWQGPQTIVFGHDARTGLQQHPFAIGLDSGCCYGGELSGYLLPQREIVAVPGSKRGVDKRNRTPQSTPPAGIAFGGPTSSGATPPSGIRYVGGRSPEPGPSPSVAATTQMLRDLMARSQAQASHPTSPHREGPSFPTAPSTTTVRGKSASPMPLDSAITHAVPASAQLSRDGSLSAIPVPAPAKTAPTVVPAPASSVKRQEPAPAAKVPMPAPRSAATSPPPAPTNGSTTAVAAAAGAPARADDTSQALWRHLVSFAAQLASKHETALPALALLNGGPMKSLRDDVLDDEGIPAEDWAALVKGFVRSIAKGGAHGDDKLHWVQDVLDARADVSAKLDRPYLLKLLTPYADADNEKQMLTRSVVKATLISLR